MEHKTRKIGIAIITYNRPDSFKECLEFIYKNKTDEMILCAVKNKNVDYGDDSWKDMLDKFIHVPDHLGVGYCKNRALEYFLKEDCTDIFLIEDDTVVTDINVFDVYINTAKHYGLKHLNCMYHSYHYVNYKKVFEQQKPRLTITNTETGLNLSLYFDIYGCFSYYEANSLKRVGLFDERFINAMEHVEHTMRYINLDWYTPFRWFADVADSSKYFKNISEETTICPDNSSDEEKQLHEQNKKAAMMLYTNILKRPMQDFSKCEISILIEKLKSICQQNS